MNTMKMSLPYVAATFLMASLLLGLGGCAKDPPPSLWDPNLGNGPAPTIAGVSPSDSALGGVTLVTITGANFSPVKSNNLVFFNVSLAEVLQASATQLVVRAPVIVSDSVVLKVAVQGVELFSNSKLYKLVAAVVEFGGLPNAVEEPNGITVDALGNLYVSLLSSGGTGLGVKKITQAGGRTDYSPAFSTSVNRWTAMKYGRDGGIYTTSNRNAVFRIPPGGGNSAPWVSVGGAGISFAYDLDHDAQGNLWVAGDNADLARIATDRSVRAFPFTGDVRSVRVFNGYLYCATKNDTVWNIWRSRIVSADSLAPRELYFNFTNSYRNAAAYSITFANDGDMYVGTDSLAGTIVVVHPDKTTEKFYPGLFTRGRAVGLAYGIGNEMYVARTGTADADKRILRVNTQKPGAPYYGRQ